jgi:hypothetical protein
LTYNKAIKGGYPDIAEIDWPTWINAGEFPIMPYKIALFSSGGNCIIFTIFLGILFRLMMPDPASEPTLKFTLVSRVPRLG